MRLLNVDEKELDSALVFRVETVERGNLPAEWRSGVTAEDQDDGPLASQRRELHSCFRVERFQRDIRSLIANLQNSCSGTQPHLPERNNGKDDTRRFRHHAAEDAWRLTHCSVKTSDHDRVDHCDQNQDSEEYFRKPSHQFIKQRQSIFQTVCFVISPRSMFQVYLSAYRWRLLLRPSDIT